LAAFLQVRYYEQTFPAGGGFCTLRLRVITAAYDLHRLFLSAPANCKKAICYRLAESYIPSPIVVLMITAILNLCNKQ
jgi:hypothetical protein